MMIALWLIWTMGIVLALAICIPVFILYYRITYKRSTHTDLDQRREASAGTAATVTLALLVVLVIFMATFYFNTFTTVEPSTAFVRWAARPDTNGDYHDEIVWQSDTKQLAVFKTSPLLKGTERLDYSPYSMNISNGHYCSVKISWGGDPQKLLPITRRAKAENIPTVDYLSCFTERRLRGLVEPSDTWQKEVRSKFRIRVREALKGLPKGVVADPIFEGITTLQPE